MCDLGYGDYESCQAWTERRVRRSRKPHTCDACGATIPAGSSYWRRSYVQEGSGHDEPCCDACWSIAEEFGASHRMTPTPSSLYEYVRGCADDGDAESRRWGQLTDEMRARDPRKSR